MYIIYTLSLQEHKCNNTLIYYPNAIDRVDEHGFTKKKMKQWEEKTSKLGAWKGDGSYEGQDEWACSIFG